MTHTSEDAPAPEDATALAVHRTTDDPIAGMLRLAIEKDMSVEGIEKLVALHERMADRLAEQQLGAALSQFQGQCPPIAKTSVANILSKKTGARYSYTYAELDEIARTAGPWLHRLGLSYGWDTVMTDRELRCTCTLRHAAGGRATATFACPVVESDSMSAPQRVAAALTYARRQSLIQVLGLTTAEPDADGTTHEPISEDQVAQLEGLLAGVTMSKARLLRLLGVERVGDIPAPLYDVAVNAIEAKRRAQQGSAP